MVKKEYMKPAMRVEKVQYQSHMLAGSLRSVKSSGLDDDEELEYSDEGSDLEFAW